MTERKAIYYELLVLRCCRGQKDALDELVRSWERPLLYYIRRLVESEQEAWGVLQETWITVLRGIRRLREPRKLPIWLYSIARQTALGHLRARYSEQTVFEKAGYISLIRDCDQDLAFDNAEQVHYGLDQISLPHRDVLTLFFLQDLSVEDIAQVLHVPTGTVKSRLYYAKRALKEVLEKEAGSDE